MTRLSRVKRAARGVMMAALLLAAPAFGAGLLDKVNSVADPGQTGIICVFGPKAFPVIVGKTEGPFGYKAFSVKEKKPGEKPKPDEPVIEPPDLREAIAGATRFGKGRAVALGSTGFLNDTVLAKEDTGRFLINAVRWAAKAWPKTLNSEIRVGIIGAHGAEEYLGARGFKVTLVEPGKTDGVDVLVLLEDDVQLQQVAALYKFVENGGGLIAASAAYGWSERNEDKSLGSDYPLNRLFIPMGLGWAGGTAERTTETGFSTKEKPNKMVHALQAFRMMATQAGKKNPDVKKPDTSEAIAILARAGQFLPPDEPYVGARFPILRNKYGERAGPSLQHGVGVYNLPGRVIALLASDELARTPPEKLKAHPLAKLFPGLVPKTAKPVRKVVQIDTNVPAWHSIGLYAAPGEIVTVTLPEEAVDKGFGARIGVHTDGIWVRPDWNRPPTVSRHFSLKGASTRIASSFGGLVVIDVPGGTGLDSISVTVDGAYEAPLYELGKTTPDQWKKQRLLPGPWAELASSKVILTVPSEYVRTLKDPAALMKEWDKVLDAVADLAAIDRYRKRPERIVADVQISIGYMHSGYPVMTFSDQYRALPDINTLKNGSWGLFHELGHNHQNGGWTFEGTGEVTVNLFSLYVYEKVCGKNAAQARGAGSSPQGIIKALSEHMSKGSPFDGWKGDSGLALGMYVQLIDNFGWDPFKKVFDQYHKEAGPGSDDEKRDMWMLRFSRAVNKNLGPFFQAWGVPTSDAARAEIADLPAWMPPGVRLPKHLKTAAK